MKVSKTIWGLLFVTLTIQSAWARSTYPQNPNSTVTPGSLCDHPDAYRYPEHIAYCDRDVNRQTKHEVIAEYNQDLGYNIRPEDRNQFKIDHLIPLCMGGSNEKNNLWPQHQSVYTITDPLEGTACEKMASGRLVQKRAVELLMRAKQHLEEAPAILREIESL